MNKYPCPSCGYMMFDELPGSQDICEICFWQDDLIDLEELYQAMGPNKVSLYEAQKIFQKFGAIEKRFINNVRKPGIDDKKDPNWRLLNQAIDKKANNLSFEYPNVYYWNRRYSSLYTVEKDHLCPVCGFDFYEDTGKLPWNGDSASDEICASCGIQFGYYDAAGGSIERRQDIYKEWREKWIKNGMKWNNQEEYKPKDWNPKEQLKRIL